MLYQENQFLIFLFTFLVGGGACVLWGMLNLCFSRIKSKIILGIKDAVCMILIGALMFVSILFFNYGEVRAYIVVGYFLGFYLVMKTYKFILAKFSLKLYNFNNKK